MIRRIERADGTRWQVYGRAGGRKVYVGTFDSEREAKSAERRHLVTQEQIAAGELPADLDASRTLGDGLDAWLKHIADQRSCDEYESRCDLYIRKQIGSIPIARFKPKTIVDWRASLQGQVSNRSINSIKATLAAAFRFFVEREWISKNPCDGVRALPVLDRSFEWVRTTEGVTRLLGECPESVRPIVALMFGTGMRVNEVLCLHWDDIDLEHRLIHVQRGRKGPPKSGRMRHVPIFDSVVPVLRELRLARGNATGLVFPGKGRNADGTPRPLNLSSVRDPFKRACVRAGFAGKLRIHDARHSFAGLYLVDGGDIFRLSKILGHSSVKITQDTYGHLRPDAFTMDYGRVAFRMPSASNVVALRAS